LNSCAASNGLKLLTRVYAPDLTEKYEFELEGYIGKYVVERKYKRMNLRPEEEKGKE
jgi:hypothetical protein